MYRDILISFTANRNKKTTECLIFKYKFRGRGMCVGFTHAPSQTMGFYFISISFYFSQIYAITTYSTWQNQTTAGFYIKITQV